MPSFRAELRTSSESAKSVLCGDSNVVVNRDLPSRVFNDSSQEFPLTQMSWTEFCDQIDNVLAPVGGIRKRHARISFFFTMLSLLLLIVFPLVLTRPQLKIMNREGGRGQYWYVQVIIMSLMTVPFIGTCWLVARTKKMDFQICEELRSVCEQGTARQPGDVEFLFRAEIARDEFDRAKIIKYIQVKINGESDGTGTDDNAAAGSRNRPSTPETTHSHESFVDDREQDVLSGFDLEEGGNRQDVFSRFDLGEGGTRRVD